MSHLDPPCSYALTRQEADHLKISSTYRTARLNIQTVTDPNYPASPETEGRENVFEVRTRDSIIVRCRYMQVRGSSQKERNESLSMTLRQVKSWQRMQSHPSVVNIQGFEVKESESNPEGDSISHLRLISDSPNYTITEYLAAFPHVHRSKLCIDIAAGLDHIHCNAIIHGAIRPSNILVKSNGTACLGEFSDEHIPSERTASLYASYIAPELVDVKRLQKLCIDNYRDINYEGEYKTESDIFALGSCMIEIYTGVPPDPVRIPYDRIDTHRKLALLRREPTSREKDSIPEKTLSTILAMVRFIPNFRINSGVVYSWLLYPDSLRLEPTAPVFAKRKVWSAFREMVRSSSS